MNEKTLNYEQAKDKALRLLAFRAHSEKELAEKLKRAGAHSEDVERVLEFCREYSFVNDRSYALRKAKDLYNLKKYGAYRIKQELYQKGIPDEYVEEAVSEIEFDNEQLLNLIRKRLGNDFDRKNIDKCIRYFIYRGYSISEIKECISALKEELFE